MFLFNAMFFNNYFGCFVLGYNIKSNFSFFKKYLLCVFPVSCLVDIFYCGRVWIIPSLMHTVCCVCFVFINWGGRGQQTPGCLFKAGFGVGEGVLLVPCVDFWFDALMLVLLQFPKSCCHQVIRQETWAFLKLCLHISDWLPELKKQNQQMAVKPNFNLLDCLKVWKLQCKHL